MRHIIRIAAPLLLLGAFFGASAARADIGAVSVAPSTTNVAVGQQGIVNLIWTVTRLAGGNCGTTVSSTQGELRAGNLNGPQLMIVPTTLSQTNPDCQSLVTFTFSETFTIPAGVVQRAQELGVSQMVYTRQFVDTTAGISNTGTATLRLTGSSVGVLSITRQALSFESGAPAAVLGRNEPLSAITELNFNGSGLLQAQWEIAGPESTAGTPVFRPISQVRQYLAGGSAQVLRSPGLPTATTGLYFVRLRITDPEPGFEPPVIRYFVLQRRPDEQPPGSTLSLGAPAPRTLFASDTVFAWQAIPGARAYQLEVYQGRQQPGLALPDLRSRLDEPTPGEVADALSRPPVTGALVQGAQTRAVLSPMARRHLLPGRSYFWRVLAIGEDGDVIGVSPLRELRTP